ncbi:hypothetical protein [Legionella brunensis]|uniref:Uncharacterized protein n=1 Tax=Legionella brunensis TaxID=29422 RepID=A0A0W0SDV3_9GAMM|nr:hypothetical protein [Legionella brunensis]KTC81337.1 hypothetical protein Lbru_1857 [Legionella brunensis]
MKIYQNPQPQAVEKINKIQAKPSNLAGSKHMGDRENLNTKRTDKEIFLTESEEMAWRDSLEKDKSSNS